ncbi:MAG: 16S rRNA (guanine(966)-N(2))-methyltransferase RsmD [Pseudomonadota bacterium]
MACPRRPGTSRRGFMRIVGGRLAGRNLASVGAGAPQAHLRPTTDRVRESLMNVIEHGEYPPFDGARVLDLFAGTGALGLEALSRGASHVVLVDDNPTARALIRQNIETLGATGQTKLFRRDATRLGPNRGAAFDIVFLDPPYRSGLGRRALASALEHGWLAADALIIWETAGDEAVDPPETLRIVDERRYGETKITLLRAQAFTASGSR